MLKGTALSLFSVILLCLHRWLSDEIAITRLQRLIIASCSTFSDACCREEFLQFFHPSDHLPLASLQRNSDELLRKLYRYDSRNLQLLNQLLPQTTDRILPCVLHKHLHLPHSCRCSYHLPDLMLRKPGLQTQTQLRQQSGWNRSMPFSSWCLHSLSASFLKHCHLSWARRNVSGRDQESLWKKKKLSGPYRVS